MPPRDNTDTQRIAKMEAKHESLQNEVREFKDDMKEEIKDAKASRTHIYNRLGKVDVDLNSLEDSSIQQTRMLGEIKKSNSKVFWTLVTFILGIIGSVVAGVILYFVLR